MIYEDVCIGVDPIYIVVRGESNFRGGLTNKSYYGKVAEKMIIAPAQRSTFAKFLSQASAFLSRRDDQARGRAIDSGDDDIEEIQFEFDDQKITIHSSFPGYGSVITTAIGIYTELEEGDERDTIAFIGDTSEMASFMSAASKAMKTKSIPSKWIGDIAPSGELPESSNWWLTERFPNSSPSFLGRCIQRTMDVSSQSRRVVLDALRDK